MEHGHDGRLRVQLWSYNYEPEPTGIAPISATWARAMQARGHDVQVVAAHPHYPEPRWGRVGRPYRERRDGLRLLRLPLAVGRATTLERLRQELSFTAALALSSPVLPTPDVVVAVSPSFPALLPAMVNARLRRRPWVLWLQDILPDGAASTGLLKPGPFLRAARAFERAVYGSAQRIVVISSSFEKDLLRKGVPAKKIRLIYNPATRDIGPPATASSPAGPARLLSMGNIGHSQGLAELVDSFQRVTARTPEAGVRLVVTGAGVAADAVGSAIRTDSVEFRGLVSEKELAEELGRATLGVVSQRHDVSEFNLPSKLMNYMSAGLPVLASVRRDSEVARIVEASGGGWVTDCRDLERFATTAAVVVKDRVELARRGSLALEYAHSHFHPARAAEDFERVLSEVVSRRGPRKSDGGQAEGGERLRRPADRVGR
jgi:colanic acid biosynthesis glycosyl transferase WcaI